MPQLFDLVSGEAGAVPPIYKRASGFTFSRILAENTDIKTSSLNLKFEVLAILHRPLLGDSNAKASIKPVIEHEMTALVCVTTIQALLLNSDPSPTIISSLLTPIIPSLYALSSHLAKVKTSSPTLKETASGLLKTWGRVVTQVEGIEVLWAIIGGEGGDWKSNIAGEIERVDV